MLASINPLVERARGGRYSSAISSLILGSAIGGVAAGAGLGQLGHWTFGLVSVEPAARALVLAMLALIGLAVDARVGSLRLPTHRRQVNQGWLTMYRPHIYGFGFGVQLGVGVATIITTSTIYLQMIAGFLSGSTTAGGLIGLCFGVVRGLSALPGARVTAPADLGAISERIDALDAPARRLVFAAQASIALTVAAAVII